MSKARDLADTVSTGGILDDGTVSVSEISDLTVTAAELNNVAGVNSDVQTQLDLKAPLASPSFTGTATIPAVSVTTLTVGGSDVTSNVTGLGTASQLNVGTGANNVVQLDASGNLPAVDGSSLTGISSATIGELKYFSGDETASYPSSEWLKCDGTIKLKADYQDLFNTLGSIVNGITSGDYDSGIADGAVAGNYPSNGVSTVAYLNGYWYYAVGTYILTTNNHTTWNVANVGRVADNNSQFIYDGTRVVIMMDYYVHYSSDNGANWTSYQPSGGTYTLRNLAYVNGTWVGHQLFSHILYTTDITNTSWTANTNIGTSGTYWYGIQSNGNYIIASDGDRLQYSTDGTGWSINSYPFGSTYFSAINASDNVVVTDGNNMAYASGPNVNWTTITNPLGSTIYRLGTLAGTDTFWIVDRWGRVSTSTNGQTWTTPTYFGLTNGMGGQEYVCKIYTDGSLYRVPVYALGVWKKSAFSAGTWTSEFNSIQSNVGYGSNKTIWDGSQYVSLGRDSQGIYVSSDAETWTSGLFTGLTDRNRNSITYDGSIYVLGCDNGDLFSSSDLSSWSSLTSNTSNHIEHVNYLNGTYLYLTSQGEVATTTNLATPFTIRQSSLGGYGYSSAYGNGVYVITSGSNAWYSSDAITWTQAAVPSISNFYSNILWDGTQFVVGANQSNAGIVLTSTDGSTWSIVFNNGKTSSGAIHSLVYYEGVYVAFDNSRDIYQGATPETLNILASGVGSNAGTVVTDNTSEIVVMNQQGFKIPFYTYNTTTSFALPVQSTTVSTGKQNLFIRAE